MFSSCGGGLFSGTELVILTPGHYNCLAYRFSGQLTTQKAGVVRYLAADGDGLSALYMGRVGEIPSRDTLAIRLIGTLVLGHSEYEGTLEWSLV